MPNPFRIFKETNTSPNARFLRTSYGQKIIDAFFIFVGYGNLFGGMVVDYFEKPADPNHHGGNLGILDFPTLFIPLLLDMCTCWIWQSKNRFVKIVFGSILGLIAIALNLIRIVIGGILAFNPLSLFIILVIHAISQYVSGGAKLNQQVAKIEEAVFAYNGPDTPYCLAGTNAQKFTLKSEFTEFVPDQSPTPILMTAAYGSDNTTDRHLLGLTLRPVAGTPSSADSGFYLPLFTDATKSALTLSAYSVLKLNTWRVTEMLEGYAAANRGNNEANDQVKRKVGYCEHVLSLLNGAVDPFNKVTLGGNR